MRYAQFYQMSVKMPGKESKPVMSCGDRSVIILDTRNRIENSEALARLECQKRKYIGYSIHEGRSFTDSRQVTKYKAI